MRPMRATVGSLHGHARSPGFDARDLLGMAPSMTTSQRAFPPPVLPLVRAREHSRHHDRTDLPLRRPDRHVAAAVDGVMTDTLVAIQGIAVNPARATVTGPFTGGERLEDPTFAFYAARGGAPRENIRDSPPVAEIPLVDPRGGLRAASGGTFRGPSAAFQTPATGLR